MYRNFVSENYYQNIILTTSKLRLVYFINVFLTTINTLQVSTVGDLALTKWRKRRKKIPVTEDNRRCRAVPAAARKIKASNTTGENPCQLKTLRCRGTLRPPWHSGCSTPRTSRFCATPKSRTGCETGKTPEREENR